MVKIRAAVDEYLNECRLRRLRHSTLHTYEWALEHFAAWCAESGIEELKQVGVDTYLRFIHEAPGAEDSDYNMRAYAQYARQFLRWAVNVHGYGVKKSEVERMKIPHVEESEVHIYTPAECRAMKTACKRMPYPYRSEAIINVLLDTGVRASELCYNSRRPQEETGLRLENVFIGRQVEQPYIRVIGKGPGRGKPRKIPIGQETSLSLQRYINRERGETAYDIVFLSRQDHPLGVRMLAQFLTDLGDITGIEHVHPHRFRHTFAINQLLAGTSDFVLMHLMGHTSLESTQVYMRALDTMSVLGLTPSIVDELRRKKGLGKSTKE